MEFTRPKMAFETKRKRGVMRVHGITKGAPKLTGAVIKDELVFVGEVKWKHPHPKKEIKNGKFSAK